MQSIRKLAKQCIEENNINKKIELSLEAYRKLLSGEVSVDTLSDYSKETVTPGLPENINLVQPEQVPKRGLGTIEGRVALLHAIAHIEFNAINLAWDAVYRFSHLPVDYYSDWAKIAVEETQHFLLLQDHLKSFSYSYGDFSAHDGLWKMAERTSEDVLFRMALVPRVLEARGLDVTPGMIKKFQSIGDTASADILKIIYTEEIGHVETGTYWFQYLCNQKNIDSEETFYNLVSENFKEGLRGPFNYPARSSAGFSNKEIDWLKQHDSVK